MTDMNLHELSKEYELPFENLFVSYIKEMILEQIYTRGFGNCLWLKHSNEISLDGYARRPKRSLSFLYKEDERIRKEEGFVPGCPFDEEFLPLFYEKILTEIEGLSIESFSILKNEVSFESTYEGMYIPFTIEIEKCEIENVTPIRKDMQLLLRKAIFTVDTYPLEQEVAVHLGIILNELELINEMEHYLKLYQIFENETIEGVRIQNALEGILKEKEMGNFRERYDMILGYRDYHYMKKKWKVLLRRQKLLSPAWDKVIDLMSLVVSPILEATEEDRIFFGDWMPELRRYLD